MLYFEAVGFPWNRVVKRVQPTAADPSPQSLLCPSTQDMLDEALVRAGRFSMIIEVEAPDKKGREQLFAEKMKGMKIDSRVRRGRWGGGQRQ